MSSLTLIGVVSFFSIVFPNVPESLVGFVEDWRSLPFFGCGAILWRHVPLSILRLV